MTTHARRHLWTLRRFLAPAAATCALTALLTPTLSLAQAGSGLETELKALQMRQQKELLEMQKKMEAQTTAKPGDPQYLQNKISELELKLKSYEEPVVDVKHQRPAMQKNIDHVWTLMAAYGLLHAGGLCFAGNGFGPCQELINCAMKGLLDFCSASIVLPALWLHAHVWSVVGRVHCGHSFWLSNFAADSPLWTFWFFQVVFAGAACTIASGAMAERTKFMGYMAYTALFSGLVYPVFGHWAWAA